MNIKKFIFYTISIVVSTMLFSACSQDEGFGGNSHIKGVLVERSYNNDFSILQSEKIAKDEDIYIICGNNLNICENTTTSYTGNFTFKYLWPGNYKVYYYSKDTTKVTNDKTEIVKEITLEKNSTFDLDTIFTYKTLDWNEGFGSISGSVMIINYTNESKYPNLEIKDVSEAQDYEVYINYNYSDVYTDKTRTQSDGSFVFKNLLKGHFKIFLYSENIQDSTANDVIEMEFDISEANKNVKIDDIIYVKKH